MEPHQHGSPVAWCRTTGYCGMARTWCVFCTRQKTVPSASSFSCVEERRTKELCQGYSFTVLQRKGNSRKTSQELRSTLQTLSSSILLLWCSIPGLQNLATIIVRLFPAKFRFEVDLWRHKLQAFQRFFASAKTAKTMQWPRDLHLQSLARCMGMTTETYKMACLFTACVMAP